MFDRFSYRYLTSVLLYLQEKEQDKKLEKFAKLEIDDLKSQAEGEDKESEDAVIESIKAAKDRTSYFKSRDDYK